MAQLVVRNLDDEVKAKLRRRAEAHGHSMEEEVRAILRDAVKEEARLKGDLEPALRLVSLASGYGRVRRYRSSEGTPSSHPPLTEWSFSIPT